MTHSQWHTHSDTAQSYTNANEPKPRREEKERRRWTPHYTSAPPPVHAPMFRFKSLLNTISFSRSSGLSASALTTSNNLLCTSAAGVKSFCWPQSSKGPIILSIRTTLCSSTTFYFRLWNCTQTEILSLATAGGFVRPRGPAGPLLSGLQTYSTVHDPEEVLQWCVKKNIPFDMHSCSYCRLAYMCGDTEESLKDCGRQTFFFFLSIPLAVKKH